MMATMMMTVAQKHTKIHKHTQTPTNTQTQIHKHTNTNTQTQIHKHKYTNTNTQTQIHKHKYTNTNTQIHKHMREQLTCEDKDQYRAHHSRPLLHQSRPPLLKKKRLAL